MTTIETSSAAGTSAVLVDGAAGGLSLGGVESGSSNDSPAVALDPVHDLKVMILDDEPYNCMVVAKYLRDAGHRRLLTSSDSSAAVRVIADQKPSLLLLDVMMPQVSGLDILRALKSDNMTKHFPVLVLTASTDAAIKREALQLGATDFLPKPVDANDLIPRVRNALVTKAYQDRLAHYTEELELEVRRRTGELEQSRREVIHCLARAAEYRDDNTGRHVMRVGHYVGVIARALGLDSFQVDALELAAQLHDVGKIGIPDAILNAEGKLAPDLFAVMQKHCTFAKRILSPLPDDDWQRLKKHSEIGASLLEISSSPILMLAARIAQTHHEWWNGTGYPLGLAGEDIPIEGRITAVADVYDALSTGRSYKAPFPREQCFSIMAAERGTHFDPAVLDAFFAASREIIEVQLEFMDIE